MFVYVYIVICENVHFWRFRNKVFILVNIALLRSGYRYEVYEVYVYSSALLPKFSSWWINSYSWLHLCYYLYALQLIILIFCGCWSCKDSHFYMLLWLFLLLAVFLVFCKIYDFWFITRRSIVLFFLCFSLVVFLRFFHFVCVIKLSLGVVFEVPVFHFVSIKATKEWNLLLLE